MTFIHKPYIFEDLETETINNERFYIRGDARYRSVTSVLSRIPNPGLDGWRKYVGAEKAAKITNAGAARGSVIHTLCETHLFNKPMPPGISANHRLLFQQMQSVLDKHVKVVYNSEFALYSDTLRTAGRGDLFCEFDDEPIYLDFKTSRKTKYPAQLKNYHLQSTIYCMMIFERLKIPIRKYILLVARENENTPQIITGKVGDHLKEAIAVFRDKKYNPIVNILP